MGFFQNTSEDYISASDKYFSVCKCCYYIFLIGSNIFYFSWKNLHLCCDAFDERCICYEKYMNIFTGVNATDLYCLNA